jgi:hypothetical protein
VTPEVNAIATVILVATLGALAISAPPVRRPPRASSEERQTGPNLLGLPPAAGDPIRIGFQVEHGHRLADLAAGEAGGGSASSPASHHLMPVLGDAEGPSQEPAPPEVGWSSRLGADRGLPPDVGVRHRYRNIGLTVKMATALDHAGRY